MHSGHVLMALGLAATAAACGPVPQPTTVTTDIHLPQAMTANAEWIYWVQSDGSVAKVARSGGPRVELVPATYPDPDKTSLGRINTYYSIAVDDEAVYYTDVEVVWKVPLDGGTPTALASYPGENAVLAIDESSVYVLHGSHRAGGDGGLDVVAKEGGAPTRLAPHSGKVRPFAVDDREVYWFELGMPYDDSWFEVGTDGGGTTNALVSVPKAGGERKVLARGLRKPSAIQVVGDDVFWADFGTYSSTGEWPLLTYNEDGTIARLHRWDDGTLSIANLATGLSWPEGFRVLGEWLYYVDGGAVLRRSLAEVTAQPELVVDQTGYSVYGNFFADETGAVWTLSVMTGMVQNRGVWVDELKTFDFMSR